MATEKVSAKYVNPFTDLDGSPLRFKKIFRDEASKPLLIDFLNAIYSGEDYEAFIVGRTIKLH
jgi:hypothetical protein